MASNNTPDDGHLTTRLDELVTLGGREKIEEMLKRFSDQLGSFLALDSNERWTVADVHRMVGLAAMLGFSKVETTWRKLEKVEPLEADCVLARQSAEAAILFVKHWLGS